MRRTNQRLKFPLLGSFREGRAGALLFGDMNVLLQSCIKSVQIKRVVKNCFIPAAGNGGRERATGMKEQCWKYPWRLHQGCPRANPALFYCTKTVSENQSPWRCKSSETPLNKASKGTQFQEVHSGNQNPSLDNCRAAK